VLLRFCIKICTMPEENGKELSMSPRQMVIDASQYAAPATHRNQPQPDVSYRWVWKLRLNNKTSSWGCRTYSGPCYFMSSPELPRRQLLLLYPCRELVELPDIDSSLPERTDIGNLFNFTSSEQQLTIITAGKATVE
jgi:hypothetical protein